MQDRRDAIRNDQINAGRQTLSVKPGFDKGGSRPARKPFVAKGHDAILERIQKSDSTMIKVTLMGDGTVVEGKLVARDKFTITVLTDEGRSRTFYKHAIEGFEPIGGI